MNKRNLVLLWVARVVVVAVLILFAVLKIYEWIFYGFGSINMCENPTQYFSNIFGIAVITVALCYGIGWIIQCAEKARKK